MKLEVVMIMFLLVVFPFSSSFAQDYISSIESVKNIDFQLENVTYSVDEKNSIADKLLIITSEGEKSTDIEYSEEEWIEIENKIKKNKQRIINSKILIYNKTILDTVILIVPNISNKMELSSW